jgi:hypothetical protein
VRWLRSPLLTTNVIPVLVTGIQLSTGAGAS